MLVVKIRAVLSPPAPARGAAAQRGIHMDVAVGDDFGAGADHGGDDQVAAACIETLTGTRGLSRMTVRGAGFGVGGGGGGGGAGSTAAGVGSAALARGARLRASALTVSSPAAAAEAAKGFRQSARGYGGEAGIAQQIADLRPVDAIREVFGVAEIENRQFVLEEIRAVAGEVGQCGVQRGGVGGVQVASG